jgi:C4-dicarboxylate-specific signal transduction histidine kinase
MALVALPSNLSSVGRSQRIRAAWVLPFVTLTLFVLVMGTLLWLVHRHESDILQNSLRRDAQFVELAISRKLVTHQAFADRLALAIGTSGEATPLTDQADTYLRGNTEVRNVILSHESGETVWFVPGTKDMTALSRERPGAEEQARMMRLTRATARPTYTEPYYNDLDEAFIEYHSPVFQQGRFQGTVSVNISLQAVMQLLIPPGVEGKYHFRLLDEKNRELSRIETNDEVLEGFSQTVSLTLPWRNLKLMVIATKTESLVGRVVLTGLIILLAIVLAWSLWLLKRRVSQQVLVDSALKASHERFVTVLDSIDAAVVVSDLDSREILFSNESFEHLFPGFGVGAHAFGVEALMNPTPSQAVPHHTLLDASGLATGVHKAEVHDARHNAWYLLRVRAVRWVDGRMVRLTMLSDITDRKEAEERNRIQQEKLVLTSRLMSVGEMASTLAHEINQPLSAIANYNMGCVRRLKSGQWNQAELLTAMEKSSAQAERAGKVVRRVREFLRRREPQREPGSINEIIEDVTELIELEAEKSHVIIHHELERDLPLVNADRIMVEQVLLNLFKNGIDAMRESPAESRALTIRTVLTESRDSVEVSVADRGSGIPAQVEAELFSPFFTTKESGMGMGLNICRSIIELHEGHLWFTRRGHGGSRFHFTLPLFEESPTS